MSRRENASSGSSSPISRFLRFHGESGHIEWYDGQQNVTTPHVVLAILDIRSSITGWSDDNKAQLTSNLVKDLGKEELTVRPMKKGAKPLLKGIYKDMKDNIKNIGGEFTTNLIGLNKANGEIEVLQLKGSALQAYLEFRQTTTEQEIYDGLLKVSAGEERKKGKTVYIIPEFTLGKIDTKTDGLAEEAYKKVKAYFTGEESRSDNASADTSARDAVMKNTEVPATIGEEDDDLPF